MRPRPAARTLRRRGSRLPALGLTATLILGGGTALAAAALSGGSAGADTTTSTTSTTTSITTPATTTPTTSAGADSTGTTTTLGGFTVTSLAEAVTAQYEQPNLPLPSDPSLEFDEGYAATTDNFGPTGTATASSLYPGQVVANAGPELALLVPGVPLPAAPVWPVEAVSSYPQTPNTASDDQPGANMDATAGTDATTATATMGNDAPAAGSSGSTTTTTTTSGGGNPLGSSSSIAGIAGSSSTSTSEAPSTQAIGTATATDTGISILQGLIAIGGVTSTATATSDGTTGSVTGSTVVTNASIAGEPVTIDASGIHAAGQNSPAAVPVSTLNTLLSQLGITVSLTAPTDAVQGASASRTLDGLKITINLDTLDSSAGQIGSLLPASATSQLPVPLPNKQLLTLDFGTVTVAAAASPAYTDGSGGGSGVAAGSDDAGGFAPPLSTGAFDSSDGVGDAGTTGTGTTPGTGTSGAPASGSASDRPTSALTPVFTGLGSGLVLLGVLAALGLAYAYKRVDDISELAGPACATGDPLQDRFEDAVGTADEWGGVGP
jgi:hypothetical protein